MTLLESCSSTLRPIAIRLLLPFIYLSTFLLAISIQNPKDIMQVLAVTFGNNLITVYSVLTKIKGWCIVYTYHSSLQNIQIFPKMKIFSDFRGIKNPGYQTLNKYLIAIIKPYIQANDNAAADKIYAIFFISLLWVYKCLGVATASTACLDYQCPSGHLA